MLFLSVVVNIDGRLMKVSHWRRRTDVKSESQRRTLMMSEWGKSADMNSACLPAGARTLGIKLRPRYGPLKPGAHGLEHYEMAAWSLASSLIAVHRVVVLNHCGGTSGQHLPTCLVRRESAQAVLLADQSA